MHQKAEKRCILFLFIEVFCHPLWCQWFLSLSLSSTSCDSLSYLKHSHALSDLHKCAFSHIGNELPQINMLKWCLCLMVLLKWRSKGRLVGERNGATAGFPVLHDRFLFSPHRPATDSSTWSMVAHEYSIKRITMQRRSMCALCMLAL